MSIEYNIKINNDVAKNAENVGDFGKSVNLIYDKIRNFNLQMVGKFDSQTFWLNHCKVVFLLEGCVEV